MAKLNLFGCWVLYELAAHSPTHVTDLAMVGHGEKAFPYHDQLCMQAQRQACSMYLR